LFLIDLIAQFYLYGKELLVVKPGYKWEMVLQVISAGLTFAYIIRAAMDENPLVLIPYNTVFACILMIRLMYVIKYLEYIRDVKVVTETFYRLATPFISTIFAYYLI